MAATPAVNQGELTRVYHGTAADHVVAIQREGFRLPLYVSFEIEGAVFYAQAEGVITGSRGVLAELLVPTAALEPDFESDGLESVGDGWGPQVITSAPTAGGVLGFELLSDDVSDLVHEFVAVKRARRAGRAARRVAQRQVDTRVRKARARKARTP